MLQFDQASVTTLRLATHHRVNIDQMMLRRGGHTPSAHEFSSGVIIQQATSVLKRGWRQWSRAISLWGKYLIHSFHLSSDQTNAALSRRGSVFGGHQVNVSRYGSILKKTPNKGLSLTHNHVCHLICSLNYKRADLHSAIQENPYFSRLYFNN